MFRLIAWVSIRLADLFQRKAPSNRVLNYFRKRENQRLSAWTLLISVPYFFFAWLAITLIEVGATEWLRVVFVWALWNGIKFLVFAPVNYLKLLLTLWRERRQARIACAE